MRTRNRAGGPLVFDWPEHGHLHVLLPAALLLSAVLHLGAIAMVRVEHPEPVAAKLRPGMAAALGSMDSFGPGLRAWLASADPALFSPLRADRSLPRDPPPRDYVPSFDLDFNPLLLPAGGEDAILPPITDPPTPVRILPGTLPGSEAAPRQAQTGRLLLRFSDNRTVGFALEIQPELPMDRPVGPAWFVVGLDPNGGVRVVLLERSSGDAQLDCFAAALLRKTSSPVPGQGSGLVWARASIHWPGGPVSHQPSNGDPQ